MNTALRPVDGPPCGDCPFRRDVRPGAWPEAVYDRLPRYDGTWAQQDAAGARYPMFCGARTRGMCGGWIGVFPFRTNLALQLEAAKGNVDVDAVRAYRPGVPLFGSGTEAAAHGNKLKGAVPLRRNKADDQCYCGHRRFSHGNSADGGCVFCTDCLMFKLDDPRSSKRSTDVDALAEEIVVAVREWAKGDPAKMDEAARTLSVSPLLGPLPVPDASYAFKWRCNLCGDCPVFRWDHRAPLMCTCGHHDDDHSPVSPYSSVKETHVKQTQPA